MSRFIDRMMKVIGDAPRPIGFGVSRGTIEKPRILLVASVAQSSAGKMAGSSDAVLLRASESKSSSRTVKGAVKALAEVPCGLYLSATGGGEVKDSGETGIDFVVFSVDTSLSVLKKEDKIGKIIELPLTMEAVMVRSVNDLPVGAVLVSGEEGKDNPLTCQTLMRFQLYASLLEKPLLVTVPPNISTDELEMLWETGVIGVVVEAGSVSDIEKVAALKQAIEKMTFPPRRRRRKMDVSLPSVGGNGVSGEGEEEEEEEEE